MITLQKTAQQAMRLPVTEQLLPKKPQMHMKANYLQQFMFLKVLLQLARQQLTRQEKRQNRSVHMNSQNGQLTKQEHLLIV
jgi:hypothetical protein